MNESFRAIARPTAAQVIALRKLLGKSKNEMADLTDVHYRAWMYYEKGQRTMPRTTWKFLLFKINQQYPDVTL